MVAVCKFYEAEQLEPVPKWRRHPKLGGSHCGVISPNVDSRIQFACQNAAGDIDLGWYDKLCTTHDYLDLCKLEQMREVAASWHSAGMFNSDE